MNENFDTAPEIIEAVKNAKNAAELAAAAKAKGLFLDEAQAEEVYRRLHPPAQELPDNELEDVSGGGGKYYLGYAEGYSVGIICPQCHHDIWIPGSADKTIIQCSACKTLEWMVRIYQNKDGIVVPMIRFTGGNLESYPLVNMYVRI